MPACQVDGDCGDNTNRQDDPHQLRPANPGMPATTCFTRVSKAHMTIRALLTDLGAEWYLPSATPTTLGGYHPLSLRQNSPQPLYRRLLPSFSKKRHLRSWAGILRIGASEGFRTSPASNCPLLVENPRKCLKSCVELYFFTSNKQKQERTEDKMAPVRPRGWLNLF